MNSPHRDGQAYASAGERKQSTFRQQLPDQSNTARSRALLTAISL